MCVRHLCVNHRWAEKKKKNGAQEIESNAKKKKKDIHFSWSSGEKKFLKLLQVMGSKWWGSKGASIENGFFIALT